MDLVCVNCGEPWDVDYVLHEEPEAFERKGGLIKHCPCCPKGTPVLDKRTKFRTEAAKALGEILGDDIDGLACELEDLGIM